MSMNANKSSINKQRARALGLLLTTVLYAGGVSAQSDWFSMGKKLFEGFSSNKEIANALSEGEIAAGLKEALRVGSETVVKQLAQTGGFEQDPKVRIPLPDSLEPVRKGMAAVGMGSLLDDLEARLNRAAEVATPKAQAIFFDAIQQMTLDDAEKIYQGPDDAATRYFQEKMSESLAREMRPVVKNSLSDVGAVQLYKNVMGQYESLPFVPKIDENLTNYVVENGMNGIFHYLAIEEANIRKDPVKQTTKLLKRVFGGGE